MRPVARHLSRLGALALLVMALTGVVFSEATFSGNMPVTDNQLRATSWLLYLHNNPTPPSGDTVAQFGLPADASVPTATTLHNYDTDCDGRPGRTLQRGSGTVGESGACAYATWHGPLYGSPRLLAGTMTLDAWARKASNGGQNPTLHVFVRQYDPDSGTYTEVTSGSTVVSIPANQPFAAHTINLAVNHTFDAGSRIEIKLTASGTNRDVDIAYDVVAYPSSVTLP